MRPVILRIVWVLRVMTNAVSSSLPITTAQGSEPAPSSMSATLVSGVAPPRSSLAIVTSPVMRLAATVTVSSFETAIAPPLVGVVRAVGAGASGVSLPESVTLSVVPESVLVSETTPVSVPVS
ncbi:MAG: hypothetical protein IPJ34_09535 [Myxococcales bacterium]|nr:hypothetical protein [Myxococcales bacterium]